MKAFETRTSEVLPLANFAQAVVQNDSFLLE